MSIVQTSDFVGKIKIANTAQQDVAADLQMFINDYEKEFLTALLGSDLYAELIAGLPTGVVSTVTASSGVVGVGTMFTKMFKTGDSITINGETQIVDVVTDDLNLTTAAVWAADNTGVTYTGVTRWSKLLDQIGTSIANCIYWNYMRDNNTQTVAMGETKGKSANAMFALPDEKLIRAWNEMVKICFSVVKFINDNPDDYGTYYIENFYYLGWLNNHCDRPDIFHTVNFAGI